MQIVAKLEPFKIRVCSQNLIINNASVHDFFTRSGLIKNLCSLSHDLLPLSSPGGASYMKLRGLDFPRSSLERLMVGNKVTSGGHAQDMYGCLLALEEFLLFQIL